MQTKDGRDDVVVFVEFSTGKFDPDAAGKPFALVTAGNLRYDIEYRDGLLHTHCCGNGGLPTCYLEHRDHEYWAAPGIVVQDNAGNPAPVEGRRELPVEYRVETFWWWPEVVEDE